MVPFADSQPWEQKRWWPIDIKLGSVGLLGAKTFCVPHFFDYRKQPSFSLHDLPWVPMDRFKQLLTREGKRHKTRETQLRATMGQGPVSLATDIHNNILELFCKFWKFSRWEKLSNDGMLSTSMYQLDLKVDDADSYLLHHQAIRRTSTNWLCSLRTIIIKFLTIFSKLGHTVLRALTHCSLLCLAK